MERADKYTGRCYCGALSYVAYGLQDIWYCHCRQCRHLTGHYMAAARAKRKDVTITGDIAWTSVSEDAAQGFCPVCHSPMFWSNKTRDVISIVLGSLDDASGLTEKGHIFVHEKGDYYEITDDLPQHEEICVVKL